ncbi:hypothetical protein KJ742_03685 [Patescibacteria group bacterium]|nr:hypothetical protein [Patescibacteria group bacterium]MBU1683023.1 hypothetical protein [Patescibacteria group bacterium]MBU1935251.1 hypothetical protein [Patescibacteria group bacterium]
MDTGETILTITTIFLLVCWFILLIFYILKKPEQSIWKIGFNFTAVFVIIIVLMPRLNIAYHYGVFSLTDFIAGLLLNLAWLLIPIIALITFLFRRIKYGKTMMQSKMIKNTNESEQLKQ